MHLSEYVNYRTKIKEHKSLKIEAAKRICKYHNLTKEFEYISNNKQLLKNPYHNLYHTACMVVNVTEACQWYKDNENVEDLIVAALFHDVGHSGGKLNDTNNIAIALQHFLNFNENEPDNYKQRVVDIITVTEFPFLRTPTTLSQKIIRDCDLLQMLEIDWREMIFVGLFLEIQTKVGTDFTFEMFKEKQIEFLKIAEFYTQWFETTRRQKWKESLNTLINEQ